MTEMIPITTPTELPKSELAVLKDQAHPIVTRANQLLVTDELSYTVAAEILVHELKPMQKAVKHGCDGVRSSTTRAWQAALDMESKLLSPLKQAETLLKTKMSDYQIKVDEDLLSSTTAITAPVPRVAGISTRKKWTGNVVDLQALIQAVAAGEAPATLLQVDQKKLDKLVNDMDGERKFPGVENVKSMTISGRSMR